MHSGSEWYFGPKKKLSHFASPSNWQPWLFNWTEGCTRGKTVLLSPRHHNNWSVGISPCSLFPHPCHLILVDLITFILTCRKSDNLFSPVLGNHHVIGHSTQKLVGSQQKPESKAWKCHSPATVSSVDLCLKATNPTLEVVLSANAVAEPLLSVDSYHNTCCLVLKT